MRAISAFPLRLAVSSIFRLTLGTVTIRQGLLDFGLRLLVISFRYRGHGRGQLWLPLALALSLRQVSVDISQVALGPGDEIWYELPAKTGKLSFLLILFGASRHEHVHHKLSVALENHFFL